MSACPDKLLLVHGLADGELDAANVLAIEAHLKACADCSAELARIGAVRSMLAEADVGSRASPALRASIDAMLDAETRPAAETASGPRRSDAAGASAPPRAVGWARGVAAHVGSGRWASGALAGVAASLALVLALPQLTHTGIEDQLVQSHVRSLMVGHLTDVATSNRHVVKPWFNGKIDFAPPVPELAGAGFPLVGGRLDYVDDHAVAAIVYRRRLHFINLFVRPAGAWSPPIAVAKRLEGYSLLRWTEGGLEYWAVSDVDPGDLRQFRQAFRGGANP